MKNLTALITFLVLTSVSLAQVNVKVNLNVKHKTGEVETFDRQKFVNFHASIDESGWIKENKSDDLIGDLLGDLDVHVGRNTGNISWPLKNQITEDPSRPGYADPASMAYYGKKARDSYASKSWAHKYEYLSDQILCTQIHPFYPDGKTTKKGWAFSQTDTEDEPLGTASGEFLARFLQEFYGTGGKTGHPKPTFVEVTNEPLWDLVTIADNPHDLTKVFEFHSTVAKQVKKLNPEIKVGGYCPAFPDYDTDDFERWNERDKHFIDVAGEDMDFWTIHLYDKPCRNGLQRYRKGSNVEATMDMLEQYSWMTLGHVKPLMISEYNATTGFCDEITNAHSDWLKSKSTIALMMQFMERADKICYAIPYFMLKYNAPMMYREGGPDATTGDYVFSDKIKVYQILKDIKGTRIDTYSDNPDLMVDAYVDGNKAYVLINNLDWEAHDLDLNLSGIASNATDVEVRQFYLDGRTGQDPSALDIDNYSSLPSDLEIKPEATYVFVFTYPVDVVINELSEETKYYADKYLQTIEKRTSRTFNINDVALSTYGEAILRIGVGRDHGLSIKPAVKVNGTTISVPDNFRGDPQTDRKNFFGVLEVLVPYHLLKEDNAIEVTFPGEGGHISTVTMQVFNFSSDLRGNAANIEANEVNIAFEIYPNPAEGYFTIKSLPDSKEPLVKVHNLNGSLIYSAIIEPGQKISTSDYKSGMYIVELHSADKLQHLSLLVD